ncbi:MAG: hypothetical protein SNJ60_05930 [Pseudanabaenaceae cyanobacterium]
MANLSDAVVSLLQQAAEPWGVIVQAVAEDAAIYLNRPEDLHPGSDEFVSLLTDLQTILMAEVPELKTVYVYSRPLGQAAVDHQQVLTVEPPPATGEAAAIPSPPPCRNREDFCFVRNRMLLSAGEERPNAQVAASLLAFHGLPLEEQLGLLSVLADWFTNPELPAERLAALPEMGQSLIQALQADKGFLRDMKVWLSRYCHNPTATMACLQPPAPVAAPEAPTPATTTAIRRRSSKQSPPAAQDKEIVVDISGLSAFRSQELPLILGTCLVLGGLAWLMRYLYAVAGGWAILITLASIGQGVSTAMRQQIGVVVCLVVLLFTYPLTGVGLLIAVPLGAVGAVLGAGIVLAMKMAAPKGHNLFSPQSLRLLMAVAALLLLIHGQALVQYGFGGDDLASVVNTNKSVVLKDHLASGTVTFVKGGQKISQEFKGGFAILLLPPPSNQRPPTDDPILRIHAFSGPASSTIRADALNWNQFLFSNLSGGDSLDYLQSSEVRQALADDQGNLAGLEIAAQLRNGVPAEGFFKADWRTLTSPEPLKRVAGSLKMAELTWKKLELRDDGTIQLSFQASSPDGFAVNLNLDSKVHVIRRYRQL